MSLQTNTNDHISTFPNEQTYLIPTMQLQSP